MSKNLTPDRTGMFTVAAVAFLVGLALGFALVSGVGGLVLVAISLGAAGLSGYQGLHGGSVIKLGSKGLTHGKQTIPLGEIERVWLGADEQGGHFALVHGGQTTRWAAPYVRVSPNQLQALFAKHSITLEIEPGLKVAPAILTRARAVSGPRGGQRI